MISLKNFTTLNDLNYGIIHFGNNDEYTII